jgi:hypothetical protein
MGAAWFDYANLTKAQILEGADPGYTSARKIARNTVRIMYDNPFRLVFRYHNTNVVKVFEDGLIILDSGGHRTRTTKARIERYAHIPIRSVWIHRGHTDWVLPDGRIFEDGIWWRNLPEDPNEPEAPDEGVFGVIDDEEFDYQAMHGEGFDMNDPDVRAYLGIRENFEPEDIEPVYNEEEYWARFVKVHGIGRKKELEFDEYEE